MKRLRYNGKLKQAGLRGVSGAEYIVSSGEVFEASKEDAQAFLNQYPGILTEVPVQRKQRTNKPKQTPESENDGTGKHEDTPTA